MSHNDNRNGPPRPRRDAQRTVDEESAEARRKLEAMFGGGSTAPAPAREVGDSDVGTPFRRSKPTTRSVYSSPRKTLGRSPSEYRMRLERLRNARDSDQLRDACDAFVQHHQLPDDAEILTKVLQHTSEKVLRDAMGQLSSLLMQGRLPSTVILEERLRDLEQRVTEDSTLSYVRGLQAMVAKTKRPL